MSLDEKQNGFNGNSLQCGQNYSKNQLRQSFKKKQKHSDRNLGLFNEPIKLIWFNLIFERIFWYF